MHLVNWPEQVSAFNAVTVVETSLGSGGTMRIRGGATFAAGAGLDSTLVAADMHNPG